MAAGCLATTNDTAKGHLRFCLIAVQAQLAMVEPDPAEPQPEFDDNPTYRRVKAAITQASTDLATSRIPSDSRIVLEGVPALTRAEYAALNEVAGSTLVDHDVATQRLEVRLVPGVLHNLAAGTLLIHLDTAFQGLGLRGRIRDLGAQKHALSPSRTKEADAALAPASRATRGPTAPSFLLDVGISESTDLLVNDANDFLTSERMGEGLRAVLTVVIGPHPNRQRLCQLTMQLHQTRRRTLGSSQGTGTYRFRTRLEWEVVWRPGEEWPSPLVLPTWLFLDPDAWPLGLPQDSVVEIPQAKMNVWAEQMASVWEAQIIAGNAVVA